MSYMGFLYLILLFFSFNIFSQEDIKSYKSSRRACFELKNASKQWIEWRTFKRGHQNFSVVLDPYTMITRIMPGPELSCVPLEQVPESPYKRLLESSSSAPYPVQNDGIVSLSKNQGYYLTVDLCPNLGSGLDYQIFEKLNDLYQKDKKAVPVGIAISGLWIDKNLPHLEKIKKMQDDGVLDITWINHTDHHYYNPDLSTENNFLIARTWTLQKEVFGLEKRMIRNGLTPSIFFRFPGLVSNEVLINSVISLSLIPLGANAWMAKKQDPSLGDLVLVHANGNEPYGIKRISKWLSSPKLKKVFLSLEKDILLE